MLERAFEFQPYVVQPLTVAEVWGRKCLDYALVRCRDREIRLSVAEPSLQRVRARIRELTRGTGDKSLEQVALDLQCLIPGWRAYYSLVQTLGDFTRLDRWLRTRLRALRLRQWRHSSRIYREIRALGARDSLARRVASLTLGWWGSARTGLKMVLTVRYFDQLGVPKVS